MLSVVRKLIHMLVVVACVTILVGLLIEITPGDPADAMLGPGASPEAISDVHERLGLDRPFLNRQADHLTSAFTGDLGESYKTGQKVTDVVGAALPVTLELVILAMLIALVVSVPLGVYVGSRPGGRIDRATMWVSSLLVATPAFVAVPLLIYVVSVQLDLLPVTGWVRLTDSPVQNLRHVLLPAFALSLELVPAFVTALRTDVKATMQEDFILNARAKGLSDRAVLFRHALRPSLFSLVTLAGVSMGRLLGGAVIVETIFALPGLGFATVNAISAKDVPLVQGLVIFVAVAYVVLNTLTDLAYRYIDPRVRVRGA